MEREGLSNTDAARVLAVLARLLYCETPEALCAAVVEETGRLIPSHSCSWIEIHEVTGFSQGCINIPADPVVAAREMMEVLHTHPVYREFQRTRDGSARAISDLVSRRHFTETDFYVRFLRKHGIEDQLIAAETGEPARIVVLTLNRAAWGFSERDKAVLNALRPAVFRLHWLLRQLSELRVAREGTPLLPHMRPAMIAALEAKGLHRREAEAAACLAEGATNREIATALDISEGTVRKHVDRVFFKLGVHNRATATRAILSLLAHKKA